MRSNSFYTMLLTALMMVLLVPGCSDNTIKADAAAPEKLISGLKDLDGKRVASLAGSCFQEKAAKAAPGIKITPVYFNDNISSVQALLDGKVDAVFFEEPMVTFWCTSYPNLLYNAGNYADDSYAFAMKKNSPLKGKIDAVIRKLEENGELDLFQKKWCGSVDQNRKLQQWSHKKDYTGAAGTLRFATDPSQEPMAFTLNGAYAGVDLEVINRVAYELNMKLEVIPMKFNSFIRALQEDKADLAGAAMSVTSERQKIVDFTIPYCYGTHTILACKTGKKPVKSMHRINSLQDLDGKQVASMTGSSFAAKTAEVMPEVKIIHRYFASNNDSIQALRDGKVDAVLMDEPMVRFWCAKYPDELYLAGVFANDTYSFAVKRNSPLKAKIDPVIRRLKRSGELDKFQKKWCHPDAAALQLEKWSHKKDYDGSAGTLRYATSAGHEPMAFMVGSKFSGMDIEVVNRIAYELNMKLEIINMNFASLASALQSDQVDMIGGALSITSERQGKMDFVIPYCIGGYTILARRSGN